MSDWKSDAERRRVRRHALDISLEILAVEIGTTTSSLQRYERGKAAARVDLITRWETALAEREADRAAIDGRTA